MQNDEALEDVRRRQKLEGRSKLTENLKPAKRKESKIPVRGAGRICTIASYSGMALTEATNLSGSMPDATGTVLTGTADSEACGWIFGHAGVV
jgi:hypothetical protein